MPKGSPGGKGFLGKDLKFKKEGREMMMRRRRRGKKWLYVLVVAAMFGLFSSGTKAVAVEAGGMSFDFHGFIESNLVIRDQNGIQNEFMDHLDAVQQRNTLKFDIDVDPKLEWGPFSVAKVHLTYRGAYDSIFDLRKGAYGDIDNKGGPSRFDFGKRDIKYENDLREAFVDFTYKGSLGSGFFRPGRQLVSWGETLGIVLLDIMCPQDNSFQMFFQNPDDLMIPLWMGRLNYSMPRQPAFGLNFDLLFIPDIRPTQFGPLDSVAGNPFVGMDAPYVSVLFGGLRGLNVRQEVPTDKREYGAKVTAEIGERLSVSLVYFRDVVNDPGIVLTDFVTIPGVGSFPTTARFTHPTQHVYGGYFSYQFLPLDIVVRGEFARYTGIPITNNAPGTSPDDFTFGRGGFGLKTFRLKPKTQWMLAIDKNILVKWLAPHQNTNFTIGWIHQIVNEWERNLAGPKDQDIFQFQMNTFWWSGKLNPSLFVMFSPEGGGKGGGTWMAQPSILYNFTPRWYTKVAFQAFLGEKENGGLFAGFIPTSELTLKLGYQW